MFGRDPVLRISGRVIFALGGKGIATGVAGGAPAGVVEAVNTDFEGVSVDEVFVDKFEVVAVTKKRFPRRDGDSGEEIKGVFEFVCE